MHYHDEVEVGCTLRLVDKAAMRGDSEDDDSEYYEDEEVFRATSARFSPFTIHVSVHRRRILGRGRGVWRG